jgi:hypothetical protein
MSSLVLCKYAVIIYVWVPCLVRNVFRVTVWLGQHAGEQTGPSALCRAILQRCALICFAAAPPIGNKQQGTDQCKLPSRQISVSLAILLLTAKKAIGHENVILSPTLHGPQAELREKLSLCVSLVLALEINSHTQKDHERICRWNEEKWLLISTFMLLINTNKDVYSLEALSVAFSLFYLPSGYGKDLLKSNELWTFH